MSLENDDWSALDKPTETKAGLQKRVKYSYTRDFLLSLSELDVCKKLPSGFDQSVIREFEDASQDRTRSVGGLLLNGFSRSDYGSSPPSKGDLSNYSKGVHGRWESRSSARSDKDESQSDLDSESGRRNANQSRKFWQNPEHDGLLGSGSFPRPSGYSSGVSAPKVRSEDQYQLNKTSEPYHPPRPYKAVPHSRRENNDSYNNETFGFSESTSEDKVEEEKKRRASFEMMRKEQHKAYQQKQDVKDAKYGEENVSELSEDSIDEKNLLSIGSESDESIIIRKSINEMGKSSFPLQTHAVRPVVPPGFTNTLLVENSKLEDKVPQSKVDDMANPKFNYLGDNQLADAIVLSGKQFGETSTHGSSNNTLGSEKMIYSKGAGQPNKVHSTSILETLFGNALTIGDGSSTNLTEHGDGKGVDSWSPQNAQSSKFAQWFLEEEKGPVSDLSVNRQNDLLSLIGGDEKGGQEVSDVKSTHHAQLSSSFPRSKTAEKPMASSAISESIVMSDQLHDNSKAGAVPAVLTCEDLEQSILSEINKNGSVSLPSGKGWRLPEADTEQPKSNIDDQASQHLLSLLQKEVGEKNRGFVSNIDVFGKNKLQCFEESIGCSNNANEEKAETMSNPGETLTLETLFGTAFMKELQSVGAPVSVKSGVGGSGRVESGRLPLPTIDDGLLSSANGSGSHINSHESSVLESNQRHQNKSDITGRKMSGVNDSQVGLDSSRLQTEFGSKIGAFHELSQIQPTEDDSFVAASHRSNVQHLISSGHSSKTQLPFPLNAQVDMGVAMNSMSKDERSTMGGHQGFFHGPEAAYQKLNVQSSSPQFHHPQMDHMGLFRSSESHQPSMNSRMKFMMPESTINHDLLSNHNISGNMLHPPFLHPNNELGGVDHLSHNPMLSQAHMSGNFPPHLLGLSRGANLPHFASRPIPLPHSNRNTSMPQLNNHGSSFVQELNTRQGFRIAQQQSNFGGLGPGAEMGGGSNQPMNPEAVQRLLEMEMRTNMKKNNQFYGGGHSHGMYGNDLDMNFGHR